jgi:MFS family permease
VPSGPRFPRAVWLLGWTSLLTDAASEAIYPLLPVFLTHVLGARVVAIGIIEGTADATSSVLKLVAGRLSDRLGRRRPLVLAGYALASASRPLIALASTWSHVFAIRLVDRIGKGVRGAPRDAMLAALAPPGARGRVFGFHRAMDHAGAIIGPVAASLFLWWLPGAYRLLFALTIVPGALAVLLVSLVPEVPAYDRGAVGAAPPHRLERQPLPPVLKRFLIVLTIFTLGNSTDAFLLFRLSESGMPVALVPLMWAALHLVKAALSTAGGALSDRLGRRMPIVAGWIVYAMVYVGFALSATPGALATWFLVYGLYFALTEGSEKALVADLAPLRAQGTAFGWYNAVLGFGALAASLLFAAVYQGLGAPAAFLMGGGVALIASALLLTLRVPANQWSVSTKTQV